MLSPLSLGILSVLMIDLSPVRRLRGYGQMRGAPCLEKAFSGVDYHYSAVHKNFNPRVQSGRNLRRLNAFATAFA